MLSGPDSQIIEIAMVWHVLEYRSIAAAKP